MNGIKTDNRAENLEWATPSENEIHSYKVLGKIPHNKGKHIYGRIILDTQTGIIYPSMDIGIIEARKQNISRRKFRKMIKDNNRFTILKNQ